VPAAQQVIWGEGWREHPNPIGYIKIATYRVALKMGLALDRFDPTLPRVLLRCPLPRKKPEAAEPVDPLARPPCARVAPNSMADTRDEDDSTSSKVPSWLRNTDEPDTMNWDLVAKYAALKPGMAPAIAKVLKIRQTNCNRRVAIEEASTDKEAAEIEAAWKWVNRNMESRIAPLFNMEKPPAISDLSTGPSRKPKNQFVSPAQVLKDACLRRDSTAMRW
jgi:hypothetical protein